MALERTYLTFGIRSLLQDIDYGEKMAGAPWGGEGQTYDLSLNFKTCRFGYWVGSHVSVGIILSWLCSGGSKPSDRGGVGHPDPEIRGGSGPSVSVSTRLLVSYPDLPLFSVKQSEIWVRDYPSFCCLPLFRLSYVGFSRPLCLSEFYPNTHGSMPVLIELGLTS